MSLAYIIRTHLGPAQLERLVRRLATTESRFVIHVNRRADDAVYTEMRNRLDDVDRVTWAQRVRCYWGGWSLVEATLASIDAAFADGEPFDHALLLTGQDYPLRPTAEIQEFFERHRGANFLHHFPLPTERWAYEDYGMSRIRYWHFERLRLRTHLARIPLLRRRFPAGYRPYGGMALWALTRDCLAFVREAVARDDRFVRFWRHTKIPDELFFQTLLLNSPFAPTIRNENLWYIDWSSGSAHPGIIRTEHLPALRASGKLFARKFDPAVDAEVLDLLDAETVRAF